MKRLLLAAVFMLLAIPATATGSPLEVSTFCDADNIRLPYLQVTNLSESPVQVYAYPSEGGEMSTEQTIEPGASFLVTGAGDEYIVYLLVGEDWTVFETGLMAVCEDPDRPEPCHECGTTTSTSTTSTTVLEETATTVAAAVETTEPTTTTTTAAVSPVTLTELPFTGPNGNLLFVASAVLAAGVILVVLPGEKRTRRSV